MTALLPARPISAMFTCRPISALLTCILSTAALLKLCHNKTVLMQRKLQGLFTLEGEIIQKQALFEFKECCFVTQKVSRSGTVL